MKKVFYATAFLFVSFIVQAQSETTEKKPRAVEPSKEALAFQTALELSSYGYDRQDALSLIQAASMIIAAPPRILAPEKSENTNPATDNKAKKTNEIVVDVVKLIADAKTFAKGNKTILEVIAIVEKENSAIAKRGRVYGPAYVSRRVSAGYSYVDYILFEGGRKAEVLIVGDHDNDLDLYVYNSSGELVGYDDDNTDRCYTSFYPQYQGTYKIVVKNRGKVVYSNYTLSTN